MGARLGVTEYSTGGRWCGSEIAGGYRIGEDSGVFVSVIESKERRGSWVGNLAVEE